MNRSDIEQAVVQSLRTVAPETDLRKVGREEDLRDALDIDSMDFLRFVVDLHARLHVDVPERDYPRIRTLGGCVAYLEGKLGSDTTSS